MGGDWTHNLRSLFSVRCLWPLRHGNPYGTPTWCTWWLNRSPVYLVLSSWVNPVHIFIPLDSRSGIAIDNTWQCDLTWQGEPRITFIKMNIYKTPTSVPSRGAGRGVAKKWWKRGLLSGSWMGKSYHNILTSFPLPWSWQINSNF